MSKVGGGLFPPVKGAKSDLAGAGRPRAGKPPKGGSPGREGVSASLPFVYGPKLSRLGDFPKSTLTSGCVVSSRFLGKPIAKAAARGQADLFRANIRLELATGREDHPIRESKSLDLAKYFQELHFNPDNLYAFYDRLGKLKAANKGVVMLQDIVIEECIKLERNTDSVRTLLHAKKTDMLGVLA